jgi:cytochrome c556
MRLIPISLLLALSVVSFAQDDEFTNGMKASKAAMDSMSKLEKKTGPVVVSAAEKLGGVYENMIPFWRQRNAADAVKWSEDGKALAALLASSANSGDEMKAAETAKALGGTCKPCHDAYRERTPEGKYRIKQK